MRNVMRLATIPIALLYLSGPARAEQIPIFNTGVDASGAPLSGGSADPHWSVVAGPGITSPTPGEVLTSPSGLYAESADSRWIWVNADGSGATGSPYTFRLTFDLTGLNASTATISGAWGVNNEGVIELNGATPTGTGALSLTNFNDEGNFEVLNRFSITGGFVAGVNTLDFLATDNENPGALNVSALTGTVTAGAVPEPACFLSLGTGAIGVLGFAPGDRWPPVASDAGDPTPSARPTRFATGTGGSRSLPRPLRSFLPQYSRIRSNSHEARDQADRLIGRDAGGALDDAVVGGIRTIPTVRRPQLQPGTDHVGRGR